MWLDEVLDVLGDDCEHAFDCEGVVVGGEVSVLLGDEEGGRVVGLAGEGLVQLVLVGEVEAPAYVVVVLSASELPVLSQQVHVRPQQTRLLPAVLIAALPPPYPLQVALQVPFHVVLLV